MNSSFFSPESIVIIGASSTSGKIGNDLLKNLENFQGEKFGVNPKGGSAYEIPFFTSIHQLPKTPEMAVIAIPAAFVAQSLRECGEKNIKNIIIISAGFKEMGNDAGEKEIIEIGKQYDMNILGPNCLGFLNPHKNLNLSFASSEGVKKGNIALVSQSGAMAVAVMDWAHDFEMGFSQVISMGNKADINEGDFLEYLATDIHTDVIVLYLEDLVDGRRFYEIAKKVTKTKPVIVVKSGVSKKGALAASSHTGALSGEKEILQTALHQCGVHSTGSLKEIFLWSEMFSLIGNKSVPEKMLLITNAGGPGVMAIDNAEKYGIELFEPSGKDMEILQKEMPKASSMHNPLDILGDAQSDRYAQILENTKSILHQDFAYLIMLTPQTVTDSEKIAEKIIEFQKNNPEKIIITSFMGGSSVLPARNILKKAGILHFNYPKEALQAYARLLEQKKWEQKKSEFCAQSACYFPENILEIKNKLKNEKVLCSPKTTSYILKSFNIPFAEEILASNISALENVWKSLNLNDDEKVVMKISSPDIPHKTDVGGVHLHISSFKQAEEAYETMMDSVKTKMPKADIKGVTLQRMFPVSREVFFGMTREESFGEVVMFGFGGIYLNIFEDVSRRLGPVSPSDIDEMIHEIKSYKLLEGVRGEKGINFEALKKILFQLSCLFHALPEICEIDINPIFSNEKESWVIDAKIFVDAE